MIIRIDIEQALEREERAFFRAIQEHIYEANHLQEYGDDCRRMLPWLRQLNKLDGSNFEIGSGGSHIWIHRLRQHVEGQPTQSERLAIIYKN